MIRELSRAEPTPPADLRRAMSRVPRSHSAESYPYPPIGLALALDLDHGDLSDLRRGRDMRAAVGLGVEADDVDDADLLLVRRDQVALRTDDVRQCKRLGAREHFHRDLPIGDDFGVHEVLEPRLEVGRYRRQVEVHACLAGLHVAAGD